MDSQTLKEQIELLIDFQEKEQAKDHINKELERIPGQIEQMKAGLSEIEERIREQEAAVAAMRKTYREYEAQIQTNQSRIEKRNAQLRSVKTNPEYKALLKEIDEIRSGTAGIEDKMLQCLEDQETAEKELTRANTEYKAQQQENLDKIEELEAYAREQRKARDKLAADCEEILPHINEDMLERYRFAQRQTGGRLAVVGARDATCMGCHMNIPPQLFNELFRGDELRFCPHCHRILYVL